MQYASLRPGGAFLAFVDFSTPSKSTESKTFELLEVLSTDPVTGHCDYMHPLAYAAEANDEDTPNFRQARQGQNSLGFQEALKKEFHQLKGKGTWDLVPIATTVKNNIIETTWVFKRKRLLQSPSSL